MRGTLSEKVQQPTILIEHMHGFALPLSRIMVPELTLRMITLEDMLEKETVPRVIGMIKGPRTVLGRQAAEQLAHKYPGLTIAYVGRHPERILAPDIAYTACQNDNPLQYTIHTCYGDIIILAMAASPLSAAVAAFVLAVTNMVLAGNVGAIHHLTIPAGNTFQHRTGHTFTLARKAHITGLRQRRVAILGAGDIGMRVLHFFAQAEAHIVYSAKSLKQVDVTEHIAFSSSLSAPLETTEPIDIFTLHLPSNVYISLKKVRQVKLFLQTSSGRNIDEEELLQALLEGRIQTALVDVFSHEGQSFAGSINPVSGVLVQSKLNPFAHPHDSAEDQARKKQIRKLIEAERLLLTPHIAYCEEQAITQTLLIAIYKILSLQQSVPYYHDDYEDEIVNI